MKFNILDYGAVSDGGLCTKALQAAIDDCFLQGGGEVVVPEGRFLTGGLRLRSLVTLHLLENACLQGSADPEDYTDYINDSVEPISQEERNLPVSTVKPGSVPTRSVYPYSRWNNAVIRAIHAENIAIIGERGSEINGQNCFDAQGEEDYRGPHGINLWYCENVTLAGYTVRDSANWAHAIQNSRNITLRNVTVLGGHDGFDVRTCDNVTVEHCVFRTGDDCIAGFDNLNVTVRNCYFEGACSILRFGGTDVLVENCEGYAPKTYGFRGSLTDEEKKSRAAATVENSRSNCLNVFLYYCDNRADIRKTPGNILLRNCAFYGCDAALTLPFGHKWCCNRSLADIAFEGCTFDGVCVPMVLECPEDEPITVSVKNCRFSAREGFETIPFAEGKNIKAVLTEGVVFENYQDPHVCGLPEK